MPAARHLLLALLCLLSDDGQAKPDRQQGDGNFFKVFDHLPTAVPDMGLENLRQRNFGRRPTMSPEVRRTSKPGLFPQLPKPDYQPEVTAEREGYQKTPAHIRTDNRVRAKQASYETHDISGYPRFRGPHSAYELTSGSQESRFNDNSKFAKDIRGEYNHDIPNRESPYRESGGGTEHFKDSRDTPRHWYHSINKPTSRVTFLTNKEESAIYQQATKETATTQKPKRYEDPYHQTHHSRPGSNDWRNVLDRSSEYSANPTKFNTYKVTYKPEKNFHSHPDSQIIKVFRNPNQEGSYVLSNQERNPFTEPRSMQGIFHTSPESLRPLVTNRGQIRHTLETTSKSSNGWFRPADPGRNRNRHSQLNERLTTHYQERPPNNNPNKFLSDIREIESTNKESQVETNQENQYKLPLGTAQNGEKFTPEDSFGMKVQYQESQPHRIEQFPNRSSRERPYTQNSGRFHSNAISPFIDNEEWPILEAGIRKTSLRSDRTGPENNPKIQQAKDPQRTPMDAADRETPSSSPGQERPQNISNAQERSFDVSNERFEAYNEKRRRGQNVLFNDRHPLRKDEKQQTYRTEMNEKKRIVKDPADTFLTDEDDQRDRRFKRPNEVRNPYPREEMRSSHSREGVHSTDDFPASNDRFFSSRQEGSRDKSSLPRSDELFLTAEDDNFSELLEKRRLKPHNHKNDIRHRATLSERFLSSTEVNPPLPNANRMIITQPTHQAQHELKAQREVVLQRSSPPSEEVFFLSEEGVLPQKREQYRSMVSTTPSSQENRVNDNFLTDKDPNAPLAPPRHHGRVRLPPPQKSKNHETIKPIFYEDMRQRGSYRSDEGNEINTEPGERINRRPADYDDRPPLYDDDAYHPFSGWEESTERVPEDPRKQTFVRNHKSSRGNQNPYPVDKDTQDSSQDDDHRSPLNELDSEEAPHRESNEYEEEPHNTVSRRPPYRSSTRAPSSYSAEESHAPPVKSHEDSHEAPHPSPAPPYEERYEESSHPPPQDYEGSHEGLHPPSQPDYEGSHELSHRPPLPDYVGSHEGSSRPPPPRHEGSQEGPSPLPPTHEDSHEENPPSHGSHEGASPQLYSSHEESPSGNSGEQNHVPGRRPPTSDERSHEAPPEYDERPPDYESSKPTPEYDDGSHPDRGSPEYTNGEGSAQSGEEEPYYSDGLKPYSPKIRNRKKKPLSVFTTGPFKVSSTEGNENNTSPEFNFDDFEFPADVMEAPPSSENEGGTTRRPHATRRPTSLPADCPDEDEPTAQPFDMKRARRPVSRARPRNRNADQVSITMANPSAVRMWSTTTSTARPVTISALGVMKPGGDIISKMVQLSFGTTTSTTTTRSPRGTLRSARIRAGMSVPWGTKVKAVSPTASATTTGGVSTSTTEKPSDEPWKPGKEATALTYLKPPAIGQQNVWFDPQNPEDMFKLFAIR